MIKEFLLWFDKNCGKSQSVFHSSYLIKIYILRLLLFKKADLRSSHEVAHDLTAAPTKCKIADNSARSDLSTHHLKYRL